MKKLIDGVLTNMTAEEISARQSEETDWNNNNFNRELNKFREKRNKLLSETDYLGASDNTMSSAMTTYRQALRDLTNGLNTVAKVNAKEFPTKPEDN
mgnify:FL=1|jgi:hypothetical protein